MTVYYKDLFDGSGDLSTHTPDVGGAYSHVSGPTGEMVLNGTGGLQPSHSDIEIAQTVFTGTVDADWAVTANVKIANVAAYSDITLRLLTASNALALRMTLYPSNAGGEVAYFRAYDSGGSTLAAIHYNEDGSFAIPSVSTGGVFQFRVVVTRSPSPALEFLVNGVSIYSGTDDLDRIPTKATLSCFGDVLAASSAVLDGVLVGTPEEFLGDFGGGGGTETAPEVLTKLTKLEQELIDPGDPGDPGSPYVPAHTDRVLHRRWAQVGYRTVRSSGGSSAGGGYWAGVDFRGSVVVIGRDPNSKPKYGYDAALTNIRWVPPGYFMDRDGAIHKQTGKPSDGAPHNEYVPVYDWVYWVEEVYHPAIPRRPERPARPPKYADTVGWNASARSTGTLAANGRAEFEIPTTSIGVVVGFNNADLGSDYFEISHGFYATRGTYCVMEHGTKMTMPTAYPEGTKFAISRRGTKVTYYVDGVKAYSSTEPRPGAVFLDCSLYLGDDAIVNSAWGDALPGDGTSGSAAGTVKVLGFAAAGGFTSYAAVAGETALAGAALKGPTVDGSAQLQGSAVANTPLTMVYCAAGDQLAVRGAGFANSATPNYASGKIGVAGNASVGRWNWLAQQIGLQGTAIDRSFYDLLTYGMSSHQGGYRVFGIGSTSGYYAPYNALYATLSGYSLTGRGGASGQGVLPEVRLTATTTVTTLGRGRMRLPALGLTGQGTTSTLARGFLRLRSPYGVLGASGGVLRVALPKLGFSGSLTVAGLGRGEMTLPRSVLSAHAYADLLGGGAMTLRAVQPVSSGIARLALPRFRLAAGGYGSATVIYEGYHVTLLDTPDGTNTATTRYTQFPFERIVRFGAKYYGIGTAGIYELDGETFDGTPIVATVQTAPSDFGSRTLKRTPALYLAGRMGADLNVTVVAAETDAETYVGYRPADKTGAQTYRVRFGLGTRATYLAYQWTNVNGEDFTLDALTPELYAQRRSV